MGPTGVRWLAWEALSLRPRALAAGLATRLIAGPTAARPSGLVGLGLHGAGYVATALGRVLDVPVAIAVLPGDLADGWTDRASRVARRADLLLTVDPVSSDRLARRGLASWRGPEPTAEAWTDLGRRLGRRFGQGSETSRSRS